jgi:hypothetical protein
MVHAVLDSAHEIPRLNYCVCDRDRNKLELSQAFKSEARFALMPPEMFSMEDEIKLRERERRY